ncbi:MAG: FkbM family methyltransferase [Candidatus Babeliales bacterium]
MANPVYIMLNFYILLSFFLFIPKNFLANSDIINMRINLAISCRDCEYIPKVPNAGKIVSIDNTLFQVMHNGIYVLYGAYHGQWMSKIIQALRGHHEPQEEKVFYEVLKTMPNSATMIELGSSWSYYSMWFHKFVLNAKNYMIEPNFEKLDIGKKHFYFNNMQGSFFNAFLGKSSDKNAIFVDWDNKQYQIPRICIDDFVEENDIEFIHILHSDIQGAEYDMLLGSKQTILNNKIGYVFISTHGDCHDKCLNFLTKTNFHIIAEHSCQESYSVDGLIVARHKNYQGLNFVEISKKK